MAKKKKLESLPQTEKFEPAQPTSQSKYDSFTHNFAEDRDVATRAMEYFLPIVQDCRNNRRAREEDWMEDYRLWSCKEPDGAMYLGRSNVFVPELRKQCEISVGRFMQGIFPSQDFVRAIPTKGTTRAQAEKLEEAIKYELIVKNQFPVVIAAFERQKTLFGTSFLRPSFEADWKDVFYKDPKTNKPMKARVPKFQGVKWRTTDVFHTYVYPESADPQDVQIYFEEAFVHKYECERRPDLYKGLEDVPEISNDMNEWNWAELTRLQINRLSQSAKARPKDILLTEIWGDFELEKGKWVPVVCTMANYQKIVRLQRNPYFFQSQPFLMGGYQQQPTKLAYYSSLPDMLRGLQYLQNDIINQTMDSLTYALNPISIIDPGFAGDVNSFKVMPGAKWFASPQGVQFANFPDVSNSGWNGMQQIRSMIQQFSDANISIAPQLSGKVRTATQSQAVENEMAADLKNMILTDEYQILQPACLMTQLLLQQYQNEDYQIRVQGPQKGSWITKKVEPADLVAQVDWVWKGSSEAQRSNLRSQQILSFMNLVTNIAAISPGTVDLPALTMLVAKEGFGLPEETIAEIFPSERKKETVDPGIENIALLQGQDVEIHEGDIDDLHLAVHAEAKEEAAKEKNEEALIAILKHTEKHEAKKQLQAAVRQQQAELAAANIATGNVAQAPGGGGFPQPGQPMQASTPSNPGEMLQGLRGVNPNV